MLALTLWPEWPWAVAHLDKDVENRSWMPPDAVYGQRIALHSGRHIGGRPGAPARHEAFKAVRDMARRAGYVIEDWTDNVARGASPYWKIFDGLSDCGRAPYLHTGCIYVTAVVTHCLMDSMSPWAVRGCAHWILRDVRVLPMPLTCSGRQGLWRLPEDLDAAIREQLEEAA